MIYPNNISSKLPKTGTSIFAIMSELSNQHNAINLSQGFPDFMCSKKLIDLVTKHMRKGNNQYAPMPGVLALREGIAEKTKELYNTEYDPISEITITAGATQAIYTAIASIIKEGDEVIVFEPAYDCYVPAILLNGGIPVHVEMKTPEYKINWDEVKKLINHSTRMIIINSPHNPTGSTIDAEDIKQLEKITTNSDIIILSDEVYDHIIFDNLKHESIASYPSLANHSFVIGSFGKLFHNTGWKIGFCLAPEKLMQEFRKTHQFIVFTCNTPIQYAMAEYLKEKSYLELGNFYQSKRDYFNDLLKPSRFTYTPASGTYFQLLNYSRISDEKETDFAVRLIKEYGISSIPISAFYHKEIDNKVLRFCFAKSEQTLEKAAEKLCKI
ncbi:MAG: methionine aminotransferase [Bacteroidota bacterium]|nr:methionine aminotransferase [Bacteroidota bacterium]